MFGAATSSPLFGVAPAASGGLFGGAQQQQQQQPGGGQQLGFFGAAQGTTGQAAGGGLFSGGLQAPALGAAFTQPGVPRSDVVLATKAGGPVTHATKWEDLSPDAQAKLLSLECVVCCAPTARARVLGCWCLSCSAPARVLLTAPPRLCLQGRSETEPGGCPPA